MRQKRRIDFLHMQPTLAYMATDHLNPETQMTEGGTTSDGAAEGSSDASANGGKNLRSTIQFPYGVLKDAELVAADLHDMWGGSASAEQLSAGLKNTATSGAFRNKVATARIFGVVSVGRGKISLTALGRKLVDHQAQDAARVEAFLHVPLFHALWEEYKSSVLPPDAGLEQKIEVLGVSRKQTAKARRAFQHSADQAGFFKQGRNRLVMPHVQDSKQQSPSKRDEKGSMNLPASSSALPAPLPDLWLTLLREGRTWSVEKTQEFIETARKLHEVLTKD